MNKLDKLKSKLIRSLSRNEDRLRKYKDRHGYSDSELMNSLSFHGVRELGKKEARVELLLDILDEIEYLEEEEWVYISDVTIVLK